MGLRHKHGSPLGISLSVVSSTTARRIMRRIWRPLLGLVVALLVLAVAGATYQAIATERAERAYPPPGQMVDVGGHSLHINCVGQGSPTVVLDAGSGAFSAHWVRVQREVSGTTHVCSYDRAGMGWSEMGPEPRGTKQISSELHTLLKGANIEGPYVLVGHSFGGLYVRTYAARYPDEVAGVVLVDSSSPKQVSHQPVTRDSDEPQKQTFAVVPRLARLGVSLLARLGVVRLLSKLDPASPELPQQQRADRCTHPLDATSGYHRTRVSCPHPNAQTGEPGEQTADGSHCPQTGGARLARAAGRSGHSLVQQHPPCGGGGDAHIPGVRSERRASDQRGHR
jgi:pimeloyl-ACP methyl ester carboxylesterase